MMMVAIDHFITKWLFKVSDLPPSTIIAIILSINVAELNKAFSIADVPADL